MDFALNEEQQMLEDATRRFVADTYDFAFRKSVLESSEGWSRETWRKLGELGVLAVDIDAADGGIGAGPVGVMLVARVFGEGLLLEPFVSSSVLAAGAIARCGSPPQRARWLPAIAAGESVAALAHDENHAFTAPANIATRCTRQANGWVLSGSKTAVYHAPLADVLFVSARTDGGALALFAVPGDAKGLQRNDFITVDGQRAADLVLDGVVVGEDDRLAANAQALDDIIDRGIAALCAEAIGTLDRLLKATIDYSRTRVQFGVPIGSFQALQHRMADMLMLVEQARSMVFVATTHTGDTDAAARRLAISGAKALIGRSTRRVAQEAVQLHGGMGMTDELDVSHCFKRLLAFELRLGTTEEHLEIVRVGLLAA